MLLCVSDRLFCCECRIFGPPVDVFTGLFEMGIVPVERFTDGGFRVTFCFCTESLMLGLRNGRRGNVFSGQTGEKLFAGFLIERMVTGGVG